MTTHAPNDPKLKLAVARMLPDLLVITPHKEGYEPWIDWKKTAHHGHFDDVLETEWLYIVSLVEALLSEDEQRKYASEFMLLRGSSPSSRGTSAFQYMTATFNQRAAALIRVLGQKEGV